ncbi:heavy metal translocating P-type ATPase [Lactobacillaceae bacterium 24-114]
MDKITNKQKLWTIIIIAAIAIFLQYGLRQPLWAQILVTIVGSVVALSMLIGMVKSIKNGNYGVDLLAILAVVATLSFSQYWAAMVVLIMLTGGDALDDYATKKANSELKTLLDNTPDTAHVIGANQQVTDTKVQDVPVGATIIIKPGEIVPLDGKVIKGESDLDESSLTGESRPITKVPGDSLMSGAINGASSLIVKVTNLAKDSQYQQLVKLVETAEKSPAHFVRLADRYAVPFTVVAIVIALGAWLISGDPLRIAEVLVVASPCPLILAAPVAMVSGMSRASRNGIIVKTGTVLEKLADAKTGAFDKTGTITTGHLEVKDIILSSDSPYTKDQLLNLAASAEQDSAHILARSLIAYSKKESLKLEPVSKIEEVTGKGIIATIGSNKLKLGKLSFVNPEGNAKILPYTAIYVAVNEKYAGAITFVDHIRPEAKKTMDTLRKLGVEKLMMLTGDQAIFAEQVAKQVGINDVYTNLLPQGKIKILKSIPQSGHPDFMVGDGVNDAPSFVTADVGIAMGAHGATAASESASVVIIHDDLFRIAKLVSISQETIRIAKQAVLIGIAICTILMLIAATGIIPAFWGAMLQEVIDTVSILWALRARKND